MLAVAPRQDGADLLLSVPGVFAARAEGLAVGQRINLRGFDADHGQDIELSVGGLPVNLPSHIHGQGYADLGFLIPEVVQRLQVTEGVADPRQGDFAVAGSVGFELGVDQRHRGWRIESGYGLYDTFRQLVMWAPEGERDETFGAVSYRHTGGYGQRRDGDTASAIVQAGSRSGDWRFRGLGILHGARANLAGVVRRDDIEAGRIGWYDAYPDATAQAQNALAARFMAGFFGDYHGEGGDGGGFGLWLGADTFRLQENFTGFVQRSQTLADTAGRGDLIEQRNTTLSAGLTGRYRTEAWEPWEWVAARLEIGLDGRFDSVEQAQNLLGMPRNQTWDTRVDASILATNVSLWGDVDVTLAEIVRLHLGLRGALLLYEVDDRLGNFVPLVRPRDTFIMGFRRSAGGVVVGPRASAEVKATEWLTLRAGYGEGYRSPQARTLDDGETAPFTTVRSGDVGAVFSHEELVRVTVSGFWTELSDDVAFEAREGRLERIGASRRVGAVLYVQARPLDWLLGSLSATYVDARLLEPPPATADDPQPAFVPGQSLPYVPPVVIRADVGVHGTLIEDLLDQRLTGRLGIGYSFLGPRPLPYGGTADVVSLFDASAGIGWGPVDLGVSLYNLFDTQWAASAFYFSSNWDPTGIPTRVPTEHVAAGSPFTFMVTLGVSP
ncbi:MAG: TonB-dependent receptor [Sandaracinaceae bacterium]